MNNISEIKDLLATPKKIVITTHPKPDGDAMGSSLGLYNYLADKSHDVTVIVPTEYPANFSWMPNCSKVLVYPNNEELANDLINNAHLIFCLDFNMINRIDKMSKPIAESSAIKILIDHHLEPEGFEQYRLWDYNACSTAELVFDFISIEMQDEALITKDIAKCLYCGIMTDSGSFKYPSVTPHTHQVAAKIIGLGVNISEIHQNVFDSNSFLRMKFLGHCLKDRLTYLPEYKTAYIYIDKNDIIDYNVEVGETDGIVNYALSISGVKLAVLFIEREDKLKLSFRSKGSFPAVDIAKNYFSGGGHFNAAGGYSNLSLNDCINEFLCILPKFKDVLNDEK